MKTILALALLGASLGGCAIVPIGYGDGYYHGYYRDRYYRDRYYRDDYRYDGWDRRGYYAGGVYYRNNDHGQ